MITTTQVDAEQELASLCGVLNASYSRLVTIVHDALVQESWAIAGVRSPEHWLTMRAGLSPFHARQVVAVARRHGELPAVMGQFADGQLSFDQVSVVARYAPAHVEASVAELAVHASVPQLRRALSRYSFDPPTPRTTGVQIATGGADGGAAGDGDASGEVDESGDNGGPSDEVGTSGGAGGSAGDGESHRAHDLNATDPHATDPHAADPLTWNGFALVQDRASAPAELTMSHDETGRFTLRFNAPADLGALVEAALTEAKDALFTAIHADHPERRVTMGDAMVEIATRSLAAVTSINRRDAFRTYLHLDTDGAWLTGKPRLPQHLTDKLTCDGILQPVWITQGAPVNVGRAQRIVPTRTRRLIEDRDRGCRFPGCPATTHLECHHLIHWADGGPTDTHNLACLCPFHHDTHHAGDFTITGNANHPNALTFTTRGGYPIHPGPTFTTPTTAEPPTRPTGSPDSPGPPRPGPAPPGLAPLPNPYRGPSGDTLSLRWVNFTEPREPAHS